jgi:hypothetical protein
MPDVMVKERKDKKGYWNNELDSLGIEPKRENELNDKEELAALADNIKQARYQDYKTAYSEEEVDDPRFDYII